MPRHGPSGGSAVFGILGWPVAHSLSPAMHTRALVALGVDGVYAPFPVRPGEVGRAMDGLFAAGVRGLNVTTPHKEEAALRCRGLSEAARLSVSANTLVRDADGFRGETTDGEGLVGWLTSHDARPTGRSVAVLGAGGVARSVAQALLSHGASRVAVLARHPDRAAAACAALARTAGGGRLAVVALGGDDGARALHDASVLVGCLPADALDGAAARELVAALDGAARIVDMAYAPRVPALVRAARERGLPAENGLGVLARQGALSLGLWLGIPPPVKEMEDALQTALEDGAG